MIQINELRELVKELRVVEFESRVWLGVLKVLNGKTYLLNFALAVGSISRSGSPLSAMMEWVRKCNCDLLKEWEFPSPNGYSSRALTDAERKELAIHVDNLELARKKCVEFMEGKLLGVLASGTGIHFTERS